MGNTESQNHSLLHYKVERLLELYSLICNSYDNNLGRLKIYRKKQFNYDYIALADKLIQRESVEDCKNILNLCHNRTQECMSFEDIHSKYKIVHNTDLWLKVYSCEISKDNHSSQNLLPLKICFEYLNFTLKEYIQKNGIGLVTNSDLEDEGSVLPRNLVYVLGCVLDAYCDLRNLQEGHHCINIMSMVVSITTPSLIYINLDKCIKFLPIPLFIFSDNFSRLDECMMQCCKYINQEHLNLRNNIVIPKYGPTNITSCGIDKIDKLFVNKFKKMVKYIHHQTMFLLQNRKSQEGSQTITTHPEQNKNNYLSSSHYGRQKLMGGQKSKRKNTHSNEEEYWDIIQNANSLQQLIKFIKNQNVFPSNLDFSLHSDTLQSSAKHHQYPKQQRIKLQQYNKQRNSINLISRLNSFHQKNQDLRTSQQKFGEDLKPMSNNTEQYSLKNKVSYSLNQNKGGIRISRNSSNKGNKGVINSISNGIPITYNNTTDLSQQNGKSKIQSILQTSGIKYCRPPYSIRAMEQENQWSRCAGTVQL